PISTLFPYTTLFRSKLEIEGFTSFRSPTCLDMTELDLFAVTGPTGAGKSSLIDAICYALYGRVPRVTNEVAACISQGMERMRVSDRKSTRLNSSHEW